MTTFLIYGANGYSAELLARAAVARGWRPILAGRNRTAIEALAKDLNLEARLFGLDQPALVDAGLEGVPVVLHCAGPFAHTSRAVADACLRTHIHYLDITGEIAVFEALAARHAEAVAAGTMLLPGVGFDVVPSDCLAVHLQRRLPSATRLALALRVQGNVSRGTATTMLENIAVGGLIRRQGVLTRVPTAWKTRTIPFGSGPEKAFTIPWGDVATAYHSTGIPNIEVYLAAPLAKRVLARGSRYFGWLLGSAVVQRFLKGRIRAGVPGPTAEERAAGRTELWGQVTDDAGRRALAWLRGPEGYTFTVQAALAVLERVLAGDAPPGFQTPGKAYGPDLALAIPGVVRQDVT